MEYEQMKIWYKDLIDECGRLHSYISELTVAKNITLDTPYVSLYGVEHYFESEHEAWETLNKVEFERERMRKEIAEMRKVNEMESGNF